MTKINEIIAEKALGLLLKSKKDNIKPSKKYEFKINNTKINFDMSTYEIIGVVVFLLPTILCLLNLILNVLLNVPIALDGKKAFGYTFLLSLPAAYIAAYPLFGTKRRSNKIFNYEDKIKALKIVVLDIIDNHKDNKELYTNSINIICTLDRDKQKILNMIDNSILSSRNIGFLLSYYNRKSHREYIKNLESGEIINTLQDKSLNFESALENLRLDLKNEKQYNKKIEYVQYKR